MTVYDRHQHGNIREDPGFSVAEQKQTDQNDRRNDMKRVTVAMQPEGDEKDHCQHVYRSDAKE